MKPFSKKKHWIILEFCWGCRILITNFHSLSAPHSFLRKRGKIEGDSKKTSILFQIFQHLSSSKESVQDYFLIVVAKFHFYSFKVHVFPDFNANLVQYLNCKILAKIYIDLFSLLYKKVRFKMCRLYDKCRKTLNLTRNTRVSKKFLGLYPES